MERIEDSLTICKLLFKSRKYVELIKYVMNYWKNMLKMESVKFYRLI